MKPPLPPFLVLPFFAHESIFKCLGGRGVVTFLFLCRRQGLGGGWFSIIVHDVPSVKGSRRSRRGGGGRKRLRSHGFTDIKHFLLLLLLLGREGLRGGWFSIVVHALRSADIYHVGGRREGGLRGGLRKQRFRSHGLAGVEHPLLLLVLLLLLGRQGKRFGCGGLTVIKHFAGVARRSERVDGLWGRGLAALKQTLLLLFAPPTHHWRRFRGGWLPVVKHLDTVSLLCEGVDGLGLGSGRLAVVVHHATQEGGGRGDGAKVSMRAHRLKA